MEKRFTEFAEELLAVAEMTATDLKHSYVGTGHLLYAMVTCPGGTSWQILLENGVNAKDIRHYLVTSKEYSGEGRRKKRITYSERLNALLDRAAAEAKRMRASAIGTEQLLIAMLKDNDSIAIKLFNTMSVNVQQIYIDTLTAA